MEFQVQIRRSETFETRRSFELLSKAIRFFETDKVTQLFDRRIIYERRIVREAKARPFGLG